MEKSTGFSSKEDGADESNFALSHEKIRRPGQDARRGEEIEERLFVCNSSQIEHFLDNINSSSKCSTAKCKDENTNYARFEKFRYVCAGLVFIMIVVAYIKKKARSIPFINSEQEEFFTFTTNSDHGLRVPFLHTARLSGAWS